MARTFSLRAVPTAFVARLRRRFRASEAWFILLAIVVGGVAGLATVALGAVARTLQHWMFRLPHDASLSGLATLAPWQLMMLPLGGLILAGFSWATRARARALVDAKGAVLGVVSEKFVRRRYAEEMEKAQRGLFAD